MACAPLARLRQQIAVSADTHLMELVQEIGGYPVPGGAKPRAPATDEFGGVLVPLQLFTQAGLVSLFSTTTIFGTPVDVTLSELAIESLFSADEATAKILRVLADVGSRV